ncbi:helix-turn-helix domain-containing protein [Marinilongibacter aquaticus]|uniref:helix-turn-helix domain-containing protein n=1 Tax=Marinilongibacter aquaticus TaxID=2975157 RepID=UPI0021BD4FF3|nr:helix-turn-helix domain-containing protein [Marinilongibacter aquaticus]UBM60762.1 helix-turn-helix domain-containing protein [Marinilongibacter aquaticus]
MNKTSSNKDENDYFTLCWIQKGIEYIEINGTKYNHVLNSVFFLSPDFNWKITKNETGSSSGYVLFLPKHILNHERFRNLQITQVRFFRSSDEIPKIQLSPLIETRVQAILQMIDELISTNLNQKEEAILSLLYTFFVYCDGKCNIVTTIAENNTKAALVYKFKKIIDSRITECHEVSHYAEILHVSSKYLNACVKEILDINAKHLIDEQLIMRSRYQLKFTDKTIKEIGYALGFSSPDYFSYFIKKHTGISPLQHRNS